MTEPCASSFYRTFVVKREPADPELLNELAQARRARLVLVDVVKRVYDELVRDRDPLAVPLGLALERYEHPFDLVARAQNLASNTPNDPPITG